MHSDQDPPPFLPSQLFSVFVFIFVPSPSFHVTTSVPLAQPHSYNFTTGDISNVLVCLVICRCRSIVLVNIWLQTVCLLSVCSFVCKRDWLSLICMLQKLCRFCIRVCMFEPVLRLKSLCYILIWLFNYDIQKFQQAVPLTMCVHVWRLQNFKGHWYLNCAEVTVSNHAVFPATESGSASSPYDMTSLCGYHRNQGSTADGWQPSRWVIIVVLENCRQSTI